MFELIKNLAKEHMVWSVQVYEILTVFKSNLESFSKMAPVLMNRIIDRHNRFKLFEHFASK